MRQPLMTLEEWLREDPRRTVTICYAPPDDCMAAFANNHKNAWEFERQGERVKDTLESLMFAISTNDRKKKCLPPVREGVSARSQFVALLLMSVLLGVIYRLVDDTLTAVRSNQAVIQKFTQELSCAICKDAPAKD